MPRHKGSKNKPRKLPRQLKGGITAVDDPVILAEIKQRQDVLAQRSVTLTKLGTQDREYLMGMYEMLVATIEPTVHEAFPLDAHANLKYAPMTMWNNIKVYFRTTLNYGQPLTITGLTMFCGVSKDWFSKLRNNPNAHPAYQFLIDCAAFIEMYNEYAAHKKQNPAGPIFILKNMGWKDKVEIEASSTIGALSEGERVEAQRRIQQFSERI